ncbi:MAG: hypothetical protein PHH85_02265 [Candidatus Methanoperedens sp.]|nr:hypothetical protein [Candidatus Methanoperedens sp.]
MAEVTCPYCGEKYQMPIEHPLKILLCPKCGRAPIFSDIRFMLGSYFQEWRLAHQYPIVMKSYDHLRKNWLQEWKDKATVSLRRHPWSIAGLRFSTTPEQDYVRENNGTKVEINANGAIVKQDGTRIPVFV